ncbi:type III-B CRISPR module RAMP protein Cmr6 [Lutibacter maritimus]|uniref:CRISPR-associated protein Cmr6 n=1 Tax=Lutibacter maritimus TaxID=593133 RepID=A0A1I6SR63_9FLAO|nr:type III-B CRISPR module RAMP protein Cmr6 [Lutibacter maritimus]SFS79390.1 CRISPR-associated protein Cmr6 [Lutibacter maritimus]
MEVLLPKYHLTEFFKRNNSSFDNYGLAVEKYGRNNDAKLEYLESDDNRGRSGKNLFHTPNSEAQNLCGKIQKKQTGIIEQLKQQHKTTGSLELQQNWRMAVGMGNVSVYNNGFTLHPIYGIPYIPAQAVKGILRNYIIQKFFSIESIESKELDKVGKKMEEEAMQDQLFCLLFGSTEKSYNKKAHKSIIDFMDVFPVDSFTMVPDIMNPHYGDYYSDKNNNILPTDDLNPSPIIFLTVKDTAFKFNFYFNAKNESKCNNYRSSKIIHNSHFEKKNTFSIVELIEYFLKEALEINGVGAKTNVGYGRLTLKK